MDRDRRDEARLGLEEALYEMKRVIVGQDAMLERVLVALLVGGHVLLEGVPGLAKTLTVKTLAEVVSGTVQAGPVHARPRAGRPRRHAHLPAGQRRLRRGARSGALQLPAGGRDQPGAREGPVGAARGHAGAPGHDRRRDLPRARAVPRARHAEPDRVGGDLSAPRGPDRPLPDEAARGLPRACRGGADRRAPARRCPPRSRSGSAASSSWSSGRRRRACSSTRDAIRYAVTLADATRHPDRYGIADFERYVEFGASPRGPIGLVQSARALALLRGRSHALVDDVRDLARDVLRHRLVLSYEALSDGVAPDDLLDRVLEAVEPDAAPTGRTRTWAWRRDPARAEARPRLAGTGADAGQVLKASELALVRRAAGMLPGEHRAPGVGAARSSRSCAPYQPGDDVRQLDPSASARTGVPHVRLQVPERLHDGVDRRWTSRRRWRSAPACG